MPLDPERLQAAISAFAGGVFLGLFTLAGVLLAGEPPTRRDVLRACGNAVFGLAAGVLVGWFLAPAIMGMLPIEGLREIQAVGFLVGAFAWVLAPFAFAGVKAWGAKKSKEMTR